MFDWLDISLIFTHFCYFFSYLCTAYFCLYWFVNNSWLSLSVGLSHNSWICESSASDISCIHLVLVLVVMRWWQGLLAILSSSVRLPVACHHTGIEPAWLWQHHTDQHPGVPAPSSAVGDERCSQIDRRLQCSDHITDMLASLHWLHSSEHIQYKLATTVFRSLHGLAPPYLSNNLHPWWISHSGNVCGPRLRCSSTSATWHYWLCVTDVILPDTENFFVFYIISMTTFF